ncbi:hypothetical protein A2763_03975 [Candidatus Kaiserbacteria bacterium RIFCSPHIGHO2_01_FULL_54_36]|uniref:Uncharacterized protein n=1 Tax=Candidatus Kaiserbacteria bacterium RIFCSPHIGHO2_01_FULL_54_36 TaxID=1798482 RepID=A0A1F6CJL3_9BACT|nr:MAG: hypothetical protein A2763_03975 [Candidatus Kaiserbacteria bacterium RIFCSPHIGHO2_01_FULL_54_36]OGG75637.1 MAG: hypothetical protein A3A41_00785 [Candidatus Kaiserbacteria bacterium RIFCSPLOWO2_01_FULL_54_22]
MEFSDGKDKGCFDHPISEEDLVAPVGKFRVVCIDYGPEMVDDEARKLYLVGDYDDKDLAIQFVKGKRIPYMCWAAVDDKGNELQYDTVQ